MFKTYLLSAGHPAGDLMDCWDGSASSLGLDTGGAGAVTAEPAKPAAPVTADSPSLDDTRDQGDDRHSAARAEVDDGDEEDDDPDALDLLSDRDDPEPEPGDKPVDPKYKALQKRARKLERSLKKHLPSVHALKELGLDVRTLADRHRLLSNIEAAAERDPRVRAALLGLDEPEARETRRDGRRETSRRDKDDDVEYPFETKDGPGRFVADLDKRVRSTQRDLVERLERIESSINDRVGGIERNLTQTQRSTTMRDWRAVAEAAAAKLDPGVNTLFLDAMHAAARAALAGEHKRSPQQLVDHYLKAFKVSKGQQDRASAAAQQRAAEHNTNLPRRPAGGRPASPGSKATPRLSEFNRDLQRRYGAA